MLKGRDGGTGQRSCRRWNPAGAAAQPVCWAHSTGWAVEAKQPLASPIYPLELNTAPKPTRQLQLLCPCPREVHVGEGQQLLPSVPTAPTPLLLSSVCATLAMDHPCAPRAPHHSPIYLFQHNSSFQHQCYLTWRCSSVCTIQSRCPRAKAPLSWGQHLHPALPS